MSDDKFEKLDAEFRRLLRGHRKIPPDLTARLASCRDCDRPDPSSMCSNESCGCRPCRAGAGASASPVWQADGLSAATTSAPLPVDAATGRRVRLRP
jgi:hypothetical protein